MLATVANLAIVVAMCMAVMVGAISTEAPEASPAMADTIAEEEYMAGVAEDERPQLCTPNLEFLHPPLHTEGWISSSARLENIIISYVCR